MMSKLDKLKAIAIPKVINEYGEVRRSNDHSLVFSNGYVASIVHPQDNSAKYSVAICDYAGYFWWNTLNQFPRNVYGAILCDTEDEVADVVEYIAALHPGSAR